ncbi:MAG: NADPH-dependent FMN reductase [Pseudoxanthomonas sp.]
MATPKVAVIIGSLRKGSFNRQLAQALEKLAGDTLEFAYVDIGGLPLYNQDDDENFPAASARFKQAVESADALLFVSPEYNRSIPGVLKNAIDIGTRPAGKSCFTGKRAAVVGASPGAQGTVSAQQHLRNVLSAVGLAVLPQPEIAIQYREGLIDENGVVTDERTRTFLQGFVQKFADWLA